MNSIRAMKAAAFAVGLAGVTLSAAVQAQQWKPTKPITVIVPWAAGGATDQMIRVTAGDLSRTFAAAAPQLRLDAVVAEFAEILRGSYWARDSRLADLVRPAREVARALPGDGRVRELAQLVHLAARLDAGPGEHGAEWDDQGSDWDDE